MRDKLYELNSRKLGCRVIEPASFGDIAHQSLHPYIKVLWLPAGYRLSIDFTSYTTKADSLFFMGGNQYLEPQSPGPEPGFILYYNRDFYCIQIHDAEVACDGLLFNNLQGVPVTEIVPDMRGRIRELLSAMEQEFAIADPAQEEMLRTYLKQLIILATRMWKQQELPHAITAPPELEFFRQFSLLVETHFREKHSVADYAPLLHLAPKTLSHRLKRLQLPQPNEIIKERILLEAKRLLIYTPMSAKEIAYDLGYEDPAYFNRLFVQKTGSTPTAFRKSYS